MSKLINAKDGNIRLREYRNRNKTHPTVIFVNCEPLVAQGVEFLVALEVAHENATEIPGGTRAGVVVP